MGGSAKFTFPVFSATVPPAIEGGHSTWQEFQELEAKLARPFAPTVPADTVDLLQAANDDGPLANPTVADVMNLARRSNRSAPIPLAWRQLHALLPVRGHLGFYTRAPEPLDGPLWDRTSPMNKRLRLREQVEWAARTGALVAVYDLLRVLPEDCWGHFD